MYPTGCSPRRFFVLPKSKIMKNNMGTLDRGLRIIVAAAILALYFTHVISGMVATVGLALSAVFILTSLVSTCPLYLPFGIDTREKK